MTSNKELADRVHGLAIQLLRRVQGADAESGLSAARLSALSTLVYDGARSVGELAGVEGVTAPAMSRVVTALEREGYVSRAPAGAEGGRREVTATESGVRALSEARQRRVDQLAAVLSDLDAEGRERVLDATELLEASLGAEPERG